jgi:hypothetical protein
MRCFFCLEEKAPSIEHVFPGAIGGTFKTDRVCTDCNSFLGKEVDVRLTDHPAVLMKRSEFGMTTSAGKPVDPMGKLLSQGTLAADPERRIQTIADTVTGRIVPKIMPHKRQTRDENGNDIVEIALDGSDLAALEKIVQRHRKRAGLEPLPQDGIQALIADAQRNMRTIEQPEVLYSGEIDTFHVQRAICKIAYELACIWIGDEYIDDPVAKSLRDFILGGIEGDLRKDMQLNGNMLPLALCQSEPKAHVAIALQQGDSIAVGARVFDAVSGNVLVANGSRAYRNIKDGRFLLIDLCGGETRHSTFVDEFVRAHRLRASTGHQA